MVAPDARAPDREADGSRTVLRLPRRRVGQPRQRDQRLPIGRRKEANTVFAALVAVSGDRNSARHTSGIEENDMDRENRRNTPDPRRDGESGSGLEPPRAGAPDGPEADTGDGGRKAERMPP